jgi:hypothetical protein
MLVPSNIIQTVLTHPEMYAGGKKSPFEAAIGFISGYFAGFNAVSTKTPQMVLDWSEFKESLADQQDSSVASAFNVFEELNPKNTSQRLLEEFNRFLQSQGRELNKNPQIETEISNDPES